MERTANFHIIKTGKQRTGFTFQFTLGRRKVLRKRQGKSPYQRLTQISHSKLHAIWSPHYSNSGKNSQLRRREKKQKTPPPCSLVPSKENTILVRPHCSQGFVSECLNAQWARHTDSYINNTWPALCPTFSFHKDNCYRRYFTQTYPFKVSFTFWVLFLFSLEGAIAVADNSRAL